MQWIAENWFLLLFGGGMLAMHLFGHGKHGGHSRPKKPDDPEHGQTKPDAQVSGDGPGDTLTPTVIPKAGRQTGKPKPDEASDGS